MTKAEQQLHNICALAESVCALAESVIDEYDRTNPHPENEPAPELTQRVDLLRKSVNHALYQVCSQCSGMGKRQHEPGDEAPWVWICGKCKGSGRLKKGAAALHEIADTLSAALAKPEPERTLTDSELDAIHNYSSAPAPPDTLREAAAGVVSRAEQQYGDIGMTAYHIVPNFLIHRLRTALAKPEPEQDEEESCPDCDDDPAHLPPGTSCHCGTANMEPPQPAPASEVCGECGGKGVKFPAASSFYTGTSSHRCLTCSGTGKASGEGDDA
jgi:hypothetical protein